ncbi:MAG: hypothetical protein ACRECO_15580, partial [Xanthobacteraceae bacterium]
ADASAHPTMGARAMLDFLQKAKQYLWVLVEIGFLTVLAVVLIHLILGPNSGVFVTSVADNVLKFANGVQPQALVGLALVLALVVLLANRMK